MKLQDTAQIWVHPQVTKVSRQDYSKKCIIILNTKPYHEDKRDSSNKMLFETADFRLSKFKGEADFRNSYFSDQAIFTEAKFLGSATFSGAHFEKLNNFTRTEFRQSVYFNFLVLGEASVFQFYQASFPDFMDFTRNDHIPNAIDLTRAQFDSSARYEAPLRRWHYINTCHSDRGKIKIDYTHFRLCFFNDFFLIDTAFKVVRTNKGIGVRVNGEIVDPANLPSNSTFRKYMKSIFPQTGQNANPDSFWSTLFPYIFECGRFKVPDGIFKVFVTESVSKKGFPKALQKAEIATFYNRQLKYFEEDGDWVSYKRLDIEYRTFIGNWLSRVWNCYGYHKEWVFWWTGIFLVSFTCITTMVLKGLSKVYSYGDIKFDDVKKMTITKRIYYSFVLTSSVFFAFSLKFEKLKLVNLCALYFLLVYLVGVLCIGYLAAFVLQR